MALRELEITHHRADKVLLPIRDQVREVLRITVFGPHFPQRAVAPEILVGEELARDVSIARDQQSLRGFFERLPADGAPIRVRYGDSQEGVLQARFSHGAITPLPREC